MVGGATPATWHFVLTAPPLGQSDRVGAKSPIFYIFLPVAPQP